MTNALAARGAKHWNTAVLLAVHVAITAADAATIAQAGVRSGSATHTDQVRLVRAVFVGDQQAEQAAKQLAAVLDRKHAVEYEARMCTADDADRVVKQAERLLAWAQQVVHGKGPKGPPEA